jgi:hypothetical protein
MTFWNNIRNTDDFVSGVMNQPEKLLYMAKLLLYPELKRDTAFHAKTHLIIRLYGRKKLKSEIESLHSRIFQDPEKKEFQKQINEIFINPSI